MMTVVKEKRIIKPLVNVCHNEDNTGYKIIADLAGAKKDNVELNMGSGGFCVNAEGEDFTYHNCYMLTHEVKPTEAKAKFDSGLLTINVPFKESLMGYKVVIQ